MKSNIFAAVTVSIIIFGFLLVFSASSVLAQNSINGIVLDHNRKPIPEINVELLDEFERLISSTKTKGAGLYFFQNLPAGVYYIQVRVGGTGFKEKKERIQLGATNRTIQTSSGTRTSGVEVRQVNLNLEVDERRKDRTPINNVVVFAQNVPDEAEKLYENAVDNLEKKKIEDALQNLNRAIEIFPEYFLALEKLGNVYLDENRFSEAEDVFTKAISVNPKSFRSHFGLAVAQNNLNNKAAAAENLEKANLIDGSSINSHLLLGIIQRELEQFNKAESSLLKAKKLSDNKVPDVHWNLGLLYYYNFKRYNEAADELELYLKAVPKNQRRQMKEKEKEIKSIIKTLREKAKNSSK